MKKLLSLLMLLFACTALSPVSAQVKHHKKKSTFNKKPNQTVFTVNLPKGRSTALLTAYMGGIAHPDTFIVKVTHGKLLKAEIKEMTEPANIRINQIFLPNGESDGPFSHTLRYPIKRKGIYKVIVGGSNMEGDDWNGIFTIRFRLQ